MQEKNENQTNIFGKPLNTCSREPLTGFFRDGSCTTCVEDLGSHTVCVEITEEFLIFSRSVGNDLSTPRPEFGFDGLKDGDRWCLCAARWLQAHSEGKAPLVVGSCTNIEALRIIPEETLSKYLIKLN